MHFFNGAPNLCNLIMARLFLFILTFQVNYHIFHLYYCVSSYLFCGVLLKFKLKNAIYRVHRYMQNQESEIKISDWFCNNISMFWYSNSEFYKYPIQFCVKTVQGISWMQIILLNTFKKIIHEIVKFSIVCSYTILQYLIFLCILQCKKKFYPVGIF